MAERGSWRHWCGALMLGLVMSAPAQAAVVRLTLDSGRVVSADFRHGDPQRPVIVLWHGFLQTDTFPLIQSLADELADNGYSVLAPTLSLGIQERHRSLSCDAVHTHALDDDLNEARAWNRWLLRQHYTHLILAGHSTGSLLALILADDAPPAAGLDGVIAISLGSFSGWSRPAALQADRAQARRLQATAPNTLGHFHFAFCNGNYVSTSTSFLSYMEWDDARVLDGVRRSPVPVVAVLGGADNHLPAHWAARLQQAGATAITVPGANHFFDGTYEFDLLDAFHHALQRLESNP